MDFPELSRYSEIAYDTETTGLDTMRDRVFGISVSLPDGRDFYWDTRQTPHVIPWINGEMSTYKGRIICHNAPYDFMISRTSGIYLNIRQLDDTVVRMALINEHLMSYDLDTVSKYALSRQKYDIVPELAAMFGGRATKNVQMPNLQFAPVELAGKYAKIDSRNTLDLWYWQQEQIEKQGIERIVNFERELMPYFIRSQIKGIRVDVPLAVKTAEELDDRIDILQDRLNDLAGFPCNPNPSKDIHNLFKPNWTGSGWVAVDGTPLQMTEAGNPSIDADALRVMKHPCAGVILDIRKLTRVRDVFIRGHVLGCELNGRVYPSINQTKGEAGGTGTGRISMQRPAMQQISKRDKELAALVRSLFLPEEGERWVSRDWSQSDFRWMSHYTKVPSIIMKYYDDPYTDYHQATADMTGIPRNATYAGAPNSKQINLGLVFGMGEGKLASEMGLPFYLEEMDFGDEVKTVMRAGAEASSVFQKYHAAIPGIRAFLKDAERTAKKRGYVMSLEGRHLRFPGGKFSYKAGGLIFQAATADMLKRKYLEISQYLESEGAGSIILSVHDEINKSIPYGDRGDKIDAECAAIMNRVKARVPFVTVAGSGKNWWDAICNERDDPYRGDFLEAKS